ncbi:hypothetical protein NE237_013870 [Protea cynaroides]|uniref:Uncharacterized protein n=1 Tax=Protea cynaroides TaxID=273540 RepID=A0A9Q0H3T5_9MAGN|nr:hypothetical protein NE237_013870 [Protea cynaroides]
MKISFVMYGRPRESLSISNCLRSSLTVSDSTIVLRGGTSTLDLVKFHGDSYRLIWEVAFSGLNIEDLNLSKQRILIYSGLCFLPDSDLVAIWIEHQFPALFGKMFPLSCHFHHSRRERESCRKMDLGFLGFDRLIDRGRIIKIRKILKKFQKEK